MMLRALLVATATATLREELAAVESGPGNDAAKLWALYLPHKITASMFNRPNGDFLNQTRAIGLELGFNVTSACGIYAGAGSESTMGTLHTVGNGWLVGGYVMSVNPGSDPMLRPATIRNIDNTTNTLCPCRYGKCVSMGTRLPDRCGPAPVNDSYGDDGVLINLLLVFAVVGLITMIITTI